LLEKIVVKNPAFFVAKSLMHYAPALLSPAVCQPDGCRFAAESPHYSPQCSKPPVVNTVFPFKPMMATFPGNVFLMLVFAVIYREALVSSGVSE